MKTFYITTPIYYVNDKPHIGHAYCTILADVLRRYYHLFGYETYMLTGVDEHGQKVQEASKKRGINPNEHCDEMQNYFRVLWKELNIINDDFIRTTEKRHEDVVKKCLINLWEKGEIYMDEYEGWYSPTVEKFFSEEELVDGKCPETGREVFKLKEQNYFFKMGKYRDQLVDYIKKNENFIQPEYRKNEILGFLRGELKDLCISRPKSRLSWGIPLPFDENYVTYVWFDALINYISAIGIFVDNEKFSKLWDSAVHLIGKDILITHSVYWPTMLFAMGIAQPKSIVATGWWLVDNTKMSKSLGNVVSPLSMKDKYDVDVLRYFLMKEMAIGHDANFSEVALVHRNNSDLADDLGNLLSRTVKLVLSKFNGKVPVPSIHEEVDKQVISMAEETKTKIEELVKSLKLHHAIEEIMQFVRRLNKYMDETAPFKLLASNLERAGTIIYNLLEGLRFVGCFLWPVIPSKAEQVLKDIGANQTVNKFSELKWGQLDSNSSVNYSGVLFPRHDIDELKKSVSVAQGFSPNIRLSEGGIMDVKEIDINDFQKMDIVTGKILSAEQVKGSEKIIKLEVDLGKEKRILAAGIAKEYSPSELVGKNIVVLTNLKARKIFGIESKGMILAAIHDNKISLLTIDRDLPAGSKVS